MAKATNRSLQKSIRASIARLRIDFDAQDLARVQSGLLLIAESIALLEGAARIETTAEIRATLREMDAKSSPKMQATLQIAQGW